MQNYDDPQVLARLAALKTMTMPQLRQEWEKLFDAAAPNNSRPFLEQRLAHRIQELAFGGLSKPVIRTLDMLADEVEGKKVRKSVISDPRNPIIGTRLIRDWKGTEHTVVVAKGGFDWNASAMARIMCGSTPPLSSSAT